MKRTMRCCSCSFEEEMELPDDTTLEQLLKIGDKWRIKHQPNCNTDPIKDGKFPTTMIMQTEGKLDPLCQLILPCDMCRAEILCNYKIDQTGKVIHPEDIDATAKLMSGTDRSRCLLHDKEIGVHDKACSDKSSAFRLDDVQVPVMWRILALTEDVCGVCQYYAAFRKCVEEAVTNGDLPADAVCLQDPPVQAQDQERLKKELMLIKYQKAKTEEMGDNDFRRFINSLHEDLELEDQEES